MQMATAMLSDICERKDLFGILAAVNFGALLNSVCGGDMDPFLVCSGPVPGSVLGTFSFLLGISPSLMYVKYVCGPLPGLLF